MPSDHLVIDEIKNEATTRQEIWPKPGFEYEGPEISHIVTNLDDERPCFGFRLEIKKEQFLTVYCQRDVGSRACS